jgi:Ca2+-binding EF-hand superfamily protein
MIPAAKFFRKLNDYEIFLDKDEKTVLTSCFKVA